MYQLYEAKNILTSEEKFNLLELHIKAGEKAINSIAYASANQYLNRALEDLPANAWEKHYDLCKYLYENLIESEFLNGNIEISQKYAHLMIENLKTDLEKTKILNVLVMQSSLQGKFQEGIDLGIKTLEILGYPVPVNELEAGIGGAFGAVAQHLAGRDILEVFKQDDVKDEQAKLAIALRATLAPAAFLSGQNTLWAYF
ncbi:MAG: hypothetical protein EAZ97_11100 [Bacteroidetes bacterium]|nr:MAG: hypothetical protein EAZ97_11100 [Bacteroidota bacterium]